MVALFLLPAATLAAWELDRRAAQRWSRDESEEDETRERTPRKHATSPDNARRMQTEQSRHRRRVVHGAGVGR